MELTIRTRGIASDSRLEGFARTQIAFALRRHGLEEARVWMHVDAVRGGRGSARCGIALESERGRTSAGATGDHPCEAIREAVWLLGASLLRRELGPRTSRSPARAAA